MHCWKIRKEISGLLRIMVFPVIFRERENGDMWLPIYLVSNILLFVKYLRERFVRAIIYMDCLSLARIRWKPEVGMPIFLLSMFCFGRMLTTYGLVRMPDYRFLMWKIPHWSRSDFPDITGFLYVLCMRRKVVCILVPGGMGCL